MVLQLTASFNEVFNIAKATRSERYKLLNEEQKELEDANNEIDQLDAFCDIAYIIGGTMFLIPSLRYTPKTVNFSDAWMYPHRSSAHLSTLLRWCVASDDFVPGFVRVHRNNMLKFWKSPAEQPGWTSTATYIVRDENGKIRKPPSFKKLTLPAAPLEYLAPWTL